jgi:Kef-type K+ transport system membrane component KefB/nucleotide-binding universal stress UspA family protein
LESVIGYEVIVIASIAWLGYMGSRLFKRLNLPAVTGFLLVGVALGPQVFNILNEEILKKLGFFDPFALAIITFIIGEQLNFQVLKSLGRKIAFVSFFEISLPVVLTYFFVYIASGSPALATLLSLIAISTAPATLAAVKAESKASGEKTTIVSAAVAINNVVCIALFSLALPIALWATTNEISLYSATFSSLRSVLGSLVIGLGIAFLLNVFISRVETSGELLVFVLSHLALSVALSTLVGASPLLTGLLAGILTVNFFGEETLRKRIFESAKAVTEPIYLIFFVLAGASLRFDLLIASGIVLFAYIGGRFLGKTVGPSLGSLFSGTTFLESKTFSLAFLSQSAIAIGLSLLAKDKYPFLGQKINAIVLGAVVFFEVVGPYFLKKFFYSCGEAGCEVEVGEVKPAKPPSVILVPVGERIPSATRFRIISELAKMTKGKVLALHIQRKFVREGKIVLGSQAEKSLKTFKKLADEEKIPVDIRIEVSENVADTICRVAEEEKAGLILMGASGRSSFFSRLTGGISDQVSKKARCPVVLISE